jgi:hypothetical protein
VRQRLFRCSAPCHNPPLEPRPNPMELALVIGTPTNNATHRTPGVFFPIRLRAATTSAPSYRPRSIGALLPAIIDVPGRSMPRSSVGRIGGLGSWTRSVNDRERPATDAPVEVEFLFSAGVRRLVILAPRATSRQTYMTNGGGTFPSWAVSPQQAQQAPQPRQIRPRLLRMPMMWRTKRHMWRMCCASRCRRR